MTTRLTMTIVPEPSVARDAGIVGVPETVRVVNQNFRQIRDLIERAILTGGLIGTGTIVSSMLTTDARTLVGDVTGLIGAAADGGATTVEKLRNKTLTAPSSGDDTKAIVYNHGGSSFGYADVLRDVLTTRGDMVRRGASAEERFAVGGANTVLKSDGTDPGWSTVTALLDALFSSSQGAILFRGSSAWSALAPGTAGQVLKTQGAGADVLWANESGGGGSTSPLTTKGDIWGYSSLDARIPVGTNGQVLTADSGQTLGVKWAAAPATQNALLDGTNHTDTAAGTVVRGDLIVGNSTPAWARLALGTKWRLLQTKDGTDVSWQRAGYVVGRALIYTLSLGGGGNGTASIVNNTLQGGSEGDAAETGAGSRYSNKFTQGVNNAVTGRAIQTATMKAERSPAFACDFKIHAIDSGTGKMHFFAGFSGSAIFANNTSTSPSRVGIAWTDGTDTNFRFLTCNATNVTSADTTVAKDAAWHDIVLWTPDDGTTWKLELDGVEVGSTTTNVPVTTTAMQAGCGFRCVGTATVTTPEVHNSYQRAWEGRL